MDRTVESPRGLDPREWLARPGGRVAVVRLGAMGDVVRTLPAVIGLRRALPQLELAWIVDDRWAELLSGHDALDEVIALPRQRWDPLARSAARWPALIREAGRWLPELRRRGFEVVLDFHGTLRSGLVAWATGARVRVGFAGAQQKEANWLWTTHRVWVPGGRRVSRVQRNLALVRSLGIPAELPNGPVLCPRTSGKDAQNRPAEPYAVLAPGASARQHYKRPPPRLLAAAAQALEGAGIVPVVLYGPGETGAARAVVEAAGGRAQLGPPTDLRGLAHWLAGARIFVGGDSGPLHLACAVGCPVVALYGPTDPAINAPWGVPNRIVAAPGARYSGVKRLDRRHGFGGIAEGAVAEAVQSLLEETSAPRGPVSPA